MTELADQFLTYSRLEQGQVRVTKKRCTLNRLLEEQVLLLSPRFESAGGRLQLHCEKTWEVETDPRAVKLILMNLLENALKYGGDPPTCEVVARESGKRIEIVVSDGGSGVERSEQKAIFRKFYQGDAELSRGKSGVGLGLAICRQFARLLKGEVYVADSSEGEGASFVFTVPFAGGRKC
jgi:signal transduction histidine kinase